VVVETDGVVAAVQEDEPGTNALMVRSPQRGRTPPL
jgi:hypothetical protein